MSQTTDYYADAAMLIRKPVSMVFEAFINPAITSKFWFTKGSANLEEGKSINWTWGMFNHTVTVSVKTIIPNEKIEIQWGENEAATVEWNFKSMGKDKTFVTIINRGFKGTTDELIAQIRDSTGGFTLVMAGLKAYLEYGIELNLVADKYPQGL